MNAGELDREVVLQRPSGVGANEFLDVATVWASLRLAGGWAEMARFGVPTATGSFRIGVHYRDDVRADWRVTELETGRTFQIVSYGDPDGRKVELALFCTELQ
jgi:SPP1 family predicted phage head-tail adaptor